MKDFKTLMIGFLLATCIFLFMGAQRGSSYDRPIHQENRIKFAGSDGGWVMPHFTTRYSALVQGDEIYLVQHYDGELWKKSKWEGSGDSEKADDYYWELIIDNPNTSSNRLLERTE